jgi:hypothetical protein
MHRNHTLCFALICVLSVLPKSIHAEEGPPQSGFSNYQRITPLDSTSQMLFGDAQTRSGASFSLDGIAFGEIGKVIEEGVRIHAQGVNLNVAYGIEEFEIGYSHQRYDITSHAPAGDVRDTHEADILKVKWSPDRDTLKLPWSGRVALGGVMYFDNAGNALVARSNFSQPFAGVSFDFDRARLNVGAQWITGDVPDGAGLYASFQIAVNPEMVFYVSYSERDLHKTILNNIVVPRMGIDCSSCDNKAVSTGIVFRIKRDSYLNIGGYDVFDLGSPMGSFTYNAKM